MRGGWRRPGRGRALGDTTLRYGICREMVTDSSRTFEIAGYEAAQNAAQQARLDELGTFYILTSTAAAARARIDRSSDRRSESCHHLCILRLASLKD